MLVRYTMINQASGSVGGVTGARNRGGNYWRRRIVPLNPQTEFQTQRRLALAAAASQWRGLTDPQRASWETYADTLERNNPVGETSRPSGINAYVSTNTLRTLVSLGKITDAPATGGRATFTPPAANGVIISSPSELNLNITLTDSWAAAQNGVLMFFIGDVVSEGVSFYKGPYTFAGSFLRGAAAPPANITVDISTPRGGYETGQKRFGRLITMDATGRVSLDWRGRVNIIIP